MKVSIIIPIYNVAAYIERCIKSVMDQTHTDIECILVDDCSPDDSVVKCQKVINSYSGLIEFKILHHERNRGLSAARNTGTDAATGAYIYYLDSDDEITPDCIQLLVEEVHLHPELDMAFASFTYIAPDGYSCELQNIFLDSNINIRKHFLQPSGVFPITAWNKLVKRTFIEENKIYFKEGAIFEDQIWSFLLMQKCSSLSIISNHTYLYHYNSSSIMGSTNFQKSAEAWLKILEELLPKVDNSLKELQIYYLLKQFFKWYTGAPKHRYQKISLMFSRYFISAHRYALAIQILFFFKWRNALKLWKIEGLFLKHLQCQYNKAFAKAQNAQC